MEDLTIIVGTADPAALYASYEDLSRRYDEAGVQIDAMGADLARLTEDQTDEREHLLAELDRLDIGRSVLLGWVSAFYAAYMFALRGTHTPWLDGAARSSTHLVDTAGAVVRPLAPARARSRR